MKRILKVTIKNCPYCKIGKLRYVKEIKNVNGFVCERYKCKNCGFILFPSYNELKTKICD